MSRTSGGCGSSGAAGKRIQRARTKAGRHRKGQGRRWCWFNINALEVMRSYPLKNRSA